MLPRTSLLRDVALTFVLSVIAILFWVHPDLPQLLQWDSGVGAEEWWRIWTCHWTHWSSDHLGWDLAAFIVLGACCERLGRGTFLGTLLMAGAVIPMAALLFEPQVTTYRGLSGIDSALYALLACHWLHRGRRHGDRMLAIIAGSAWLLFCIKIVFELFSGGSLFVSEEPFVPMPIAHVAGAICGTAVSWIGGSKGSTHWLSPSQAYNCGQLKIGRNDRKMDWTAGTIRRDSFDSRARPRGHHRRRRDWRHVRLVFVAGGMSRDRRRSG